ncbi:MAG TPA: ATP-binding protein [Phycisphaerales bacterium]|nr:ATP-binding protein [Phycisphaerales bacterium]
MEAVILLGIQASGKSTFAQQRFASTHIRLNLDMLRTRTREAILLEACLRAKQPFVVDNTNVSREERARYIRQSTQAGFRVIGYYFSSRLADSLTRNATRVGDARVPDVGLIATAKRLERPSKSEGFDELYFVQVRDGEFEVEAWNDEI